MPLKISILLLQKIKRQVKKQSGASSRGKNTGKATPKRRKSASRPQPELVSVSWWETLSPERKLDVVGSVMAVIGVLILLILFSAERSTLTAIPMSVLTRFFGWGIYILPIGLILMGLWLILRRIEKLPPLSLERAVGIVTLFFWLLAFFHAIYVPIEFADQAVIDGVGGGYFGSLFEKVLFNGLGVGGAVIALLAWLLIAVAMTFDISIEDMFRWVSPLVIKIRSSLIKPKIPADQSLDGAEVDANGFTVLHRPEPEVDATAAANVPVTTVKPSEKVIQWQLPDVKNILDSGSAPSVNEEFIQQRARLIEETLASFGAPVQVVEINRGPTITQFGVEPLFVETRNGRTVCASTRYPHYQMILHSHLPRRASVSRRRCRDIVTWASKCQMKRWRWWLYATCLRVTYFKGTKTRCGLHLVSDVTGHPVNTDPREHAASVDRRYDGFW